MRILFTIPAPKELYMFKVVGDLLRSNGHDIYYLVREYGPNADIADQILENYSPFGRPYFTGLIGKSIEMLYNDVTTLRTIHAIGPEIIVGDALLGHPSRVLGIPSIAFVDGDSIGIYKLIYSSIYLSDIFVTPQWNNLCIKRKRIVKYPGLQELIYLHPKYFRPNPKVLDLIGISRNVPFAVVRLSSLRTGHDIGLRSVSENDVEEIAGALGEYVEVFICSEKKLAGRLRDMKLDIPPHMFHSALFFASLFIGDTAAAVEASLLGTPAIQISPIDRHGKPRFNEYSCFALCAKNGLLRIMPSDDMNMIIAEARDVISTAALHRSYQRGLLSSFMRGKIDVTAFCVWLIGGFPQSIREFNADPSGVLARFTSV